jgi:outer membrane protein with beta-barrel domain
MRHAVVAVAVAVLLSPTLAANRLAAQKSQSSGLFFGFGFEANGISASQSDSVDAGAGPGFTLGYGINKRWALYGQLSIADIDAGSGSTYSLVHLDVGARVHFRTGPNTVVPFLQFGLTGRELEQEVSGATVRGSGLGVTFGGGVNVHLAPTLAASGAVAYTVGSLSHFAVDGIPVSGESVHAESARVYLGILWFR